MKINEEQFKDEVEKIRINFSPILPIGFTVSYVVKVFEERMESMRNKIMKIDADVTDAIKEREYAAARERIITYIRDHNETNSN